MQRDFKGGVYWDELAETCSDIFRAVEFLGVARFPGNMACALIKKNVYLQVMYNPSLQYKKMSVPTSL